MDEKQLQEQLTELAERLAVPGVAVGVYIDGAEHYAFHGVTSIENPLPVDEHTLFQFGSTGKTFTATAIMRLVEQGKIDLEAPVRTYVPELRLRDESVAERVTVLQLLNHTAGWEGDLFQGTGDGDDALARYVEKMADLQQVAPLGASVSYNNASLSLAGRVIEKVTGLTYEQAVKELIFEPLGLDHTFFFTNDIMTRRFAIGHDQNPEDGSITVSRPWAIPRSSAPAGGISANAADQIAWARFHLSDGRASDGTQVLAEELAAKMKQPTVEMRGSAIGDAVGISWMLRDVDGVRLVSHGGDTLGQHAAFVTAPERDYAFICMTNCGPNGSLLSNELGRWALQAYLGIDDADPEPVKLAADALADYEGTYETIAATCTISQDGDGGLLLDIEAKPEMMAQLREAGEEEPDSPTMPLGLLPGDGDRYIISGGPAKGMKGYFTRDAAGRVDGVHAGGRLASRAETPVPASS